MKCPCGGGGGDHNYDLTYDNPFDDPSTRRHFIAKVCVLVALQMCYTGIVASLFMFVDGWGDWLLENFWIVFLAMGINIVIGIMMCYCVFLFRKVPWNYMLLIIFVNCKAITVSYVCIHFAPKLVLYAILSTAGLCFILTVFALFAPCDFTSCWVLVLVSLICLMIAGIFLLIFPSRILYTVIVSVAIIIFSFILVIDIQMMIGGKHSAQFGEDDYVIASIAIYTDIIQIFLCILQLFGLLEGD